MYLGHDHHSPGIEEVNIDRHDVYVEVMSTFPCIPAFPSLVAFCSQGLADRRIVTTVEIP
jgi:hypothetical protein